MKLPLAYYGDPILRKKATHVNEINDEVKQLVNDMIETMNAHNGMGLAAPQVHQSLRVFITCVPIESEEEEDKWIPGPVRIYINPQLSSPSDQLWDYEEGCLSIPKIYRNVIRPVGIIIEAKDLNGNEFKEHLIGLDARVAMHENDHINGVLYIDRLLPDERKELEPNLREIKKRFYLAKK